MRAFLLQNLHRDGDSWAWRANLTLLRASLDVIGGFPDIGERRYDGPVLWVRGERSDYVGDADSAAMRALFPRTVAVTVKGAGHWVHSEQPVGVRAGAAPVPAASGGPDRRARSGLLGYCVGATRLHPACLRLLQPQSRRDGTRIQQPSGEGTVVGPLRRDTSQAVPAHLCRFPSQLSLSTTEFIS